LRLPRQRVVEIQAETAIAAQNPLVGLTAEIKLLAMGGHFSHAYKLLRLLESEHGVADGALECLRRLWPSAILAHAPDLAASLAQQRFRLSCQIELDIRPGLPVDVAVMHVRGDTLRFQLSPALFEFFAAEMVLDRLLCMFPLWDAFMRSPDRIDGTVAINLLDNGSWPGLAFCEHRPGYYLIPDSSFMSLEQYRPHRINYRTHDVAWRDRAAVAYWRGSTTGIPTDKAVGWRSLPRIRLCEIAAANAELIDAGITSISQITDPEAPSELAARNLMRERVNPLTYLNYRYQIDIDGNSNAWEGLFLRLLSGGAVLKVASPLGYQQWYYDRLKPWTNFIPVDTDMADLVEKVIWLRDHDDAARKIGEAGRALAESLDQREIARSVPVIAAAMRAAGGGPLVGSRFGPDAPDKTLLGAGWEKPDQNGVRAAASECHLTLARPPGLGDYVLLADVSAGGGPARRMIIIINGKPMLSRLLAGRTTVCCPLPRSVANVGDAIDLTFCFPEDPGNGSAEKVTLHRIGITAVGNADWLGYPNIATLLAELNSRDAPLVVHDLGWNNPARPALILPRGAVPRTVRTHFGTILYADRETGRIRHGQATEVPRNLFAIQVEGRILLARRDDNGGYIGVHVRPEGPHAPEDPWTLWAGAGFARSFTTVNDDPATTSRFCLRAAGLFAAAEPNGEFTLNRLRAAEWESFHFEQAME
jgi:hypothetical protein